MVAVDVLVDLEDVALVAGMGIERAVQLREQGAGNAHDGTLHLIDGADGRGGRWRVRFEGSIVHFASIGRALPGDLIGVNPVG